MCANNDHLFGRGLVGQYASCCEIIPLFVGKGKKRKADESSSQNDDEIVNPKMISFKKTKEEVLKKYQIPKEVLQMIKKDKKNEKIWENILTKKMSTKLDFTNELEDQFKCPLCQFLIHKPVTSRCGHNYCEFCFEQIIKFSENKTCPCCRTTLDEKEDRLPNSELEVILEKLFPGYGSDR